MDYERNMRNLWVPKSHNVGKNPKAIGLSSFKEETIRITVMQIIPGCDIIRMTGIPECDADVIRIITVMRITCRSA